MQKVQQTSPPAFKREAVRLAQTSGKAMSHVARELGISDRSIQQWRKELAEQVKTGCQANCRVDGSPWVHAQVRTQGITCARQRVGRLMHEQGLAARRPRHRTITTHSQPEA